MCSNESTSGGLSRKDREKEGRRVLGVNYGASEYNCRCVHEVEARKVTVSLQNISGCLPSAAE